MQLPETTSAKGNEDKNVGYMLFALGAIFILAGIYLCTISTVIVENKIVTVYGITMTVPQAKEIHPYERVGLGMIVISIPLIAFAFNKVAKKDSIGEPKAQFSCS
jgi:uncharacterized membrane-anchored protein YitT (DUF2179 family)